ncbi:2-polyprenylphenol 6-hydroxylase [Thalassospira xianhensis]|uniref:2-octaprenylphenol hydroxylase n=1 Tax=Thalassospira xianhensis MCCC 1A02616 TaxID=1177929 RepID=A0A367UAW2_9PROT|nr:2-polyprenylphenol 6-hydroxylase [Thalassospira xianhensis]RCK04424.1 2-octaprenylphenol hydroxylase [Thalassospira xianhensis MCCC 1A02616]
MIRFVRNSFRLLGMARTLARHDALFPLALVPGGKVLAFLARLTAPFSKRSDLRPGQRLARALEELGPAFIKLGQTLATRADLIGDDVAADLSSLQDRLPPFSAMIAKRIITEQLDGPFEALFSEFDDTPVAAASIAQVHFATTSDGREVAVKVLRPDIKARFARDLDLFYWVSEIVELTQPRLRRLKPVETIKTLEDSVHLEMDLRFEASAASEFRDNFEADPTYYVPQIDWERTAEHVITMERVKGVRIDNVEALDRMGVDRSSLLAKAAGAFFQQVFRDGFFHADMHPGNLFVDETGKVSIVDFGIMGRVDRQTRLYLAEMLLGFLTRDYRRVAEVHFEAGYVPRNQSLENFQQACRSIGEPILGKELADISVGRLLGQLFQITETFGMETQPQLLMLQKTMIVAEGLSRILSPNENMWELSRPLIEEWMRENLGPEAKIAEATRQAGTMLRRLPRVLEAAEQASAVFTDQGLRLHPDTVAAMRGRSNGQRSSGGISKQSVLLWVAIAALAVALFVK